MSKMTGEELVRFCRSKIGTPYVFGMDGTVLTREKYNDLKKRYPDYVWNRDAQKIGKVCVDCSGLLQWATGIDKTSYACLILHLIFADIPIAAIWRKQG